MEGKDQGNAIHHLLTLRRLGAEHQQNDICLEGDGKSLAEEEEDALIGADPIHKRREIEHDNGRYFEILPAKGLLKDENPGMEDILLANLVDIRYKRLIREEEERMESKSRANTRTKKKKKKSPLKNSSDQKRSTVEEEEKEVISEHRFLEALRDVCIFKQNQVVWLALNKKTRPGRLRNLFYDLSGQHKKEDEKTFGSFQYLTQEETLTFLNAQKPRIEQALGKEENDKKWTERQFQRVLDFYNHERFRYPDLAADFTKVNLSKLKEEFATLVNMKIDNINNNMINSNNNNHTTTTVTTNTFNINFAADNHSGGGVAPTIAYDEQRQQRSSCCTSAYSLSKLEIDSLNSQNDIEIRQRIVKIMHSHSNYCIKALILSIFLNNYQPNIDLPEKIGNIYNANKKMVFDVLHSCSL